MIKKLLSSFLLASLAFSGMAQRTTDKLDRGLVAVDPRSGNGVFLSWRVQADEYYDVTYNVYKDGTKLNASPLEVSNFFVNGGSLTSVYTVKAVKNGVEQEASKPAVVLGTGKYVKNGHAGQPGYLPIRMKDVVDRTGRVIYSTDGKICEWDYSLNDVSLADLDGDGQIEVIVKRINETDGGGTWPNGAAKDIFAVNNTTAYTIIEAYKLDGTRLWWIDCGPNMCSMNCVEINVIAYDWDEDGKAEVVMRGADNMIIHMADGRNYNVGNMNANTRNDLVSHSQSQYAWTRTGAELLLYLNGATGAPYQVIEYPLRRFEAGEGTNEQQIWSPTNKNGGYGHRSSKYFFGAPVLDGRHASIWLGRGIYTQTKMCALDVDPATHKLTQRWYWRCNTVGSPWFGQGNHNMSIADVDGDGCDEIIYGSMTIDHNGKGLSTSDLGHGDAIHVGDLDPFRKGLEVFACNEEKPANNLRDATTSQILFRSTATGDDGRALMGNFYDEYPGCEGRSVSSGLISAASHKIIGGINADDFTGWANLNGRIYWDGDLLEEIMASPSGARNQPAVVYKPGNLRIMQTDGAATTNDTKKNHCAQGDILGDWREEIVMRSGDNKELRIYSTDIETRWRIPSLWYDPEYRQAMVWQMCGYNQPPHTGFFLGELEGITKAPVPLTNTGRTELKAGSTINANQNGADVMLCEAGNYGIESELGASPANLFVNVPSSVTGNDNNNQISYSYSSTQLGATIDGANQKGNLTGKMRLVKQGNGLLKLTARSFSYTGDTEIWDGSFYFRGTLENSSVWLNRHTNFYCGATINNSLTMEYGSTLCPSHDATSTMERDYATMKIGTLNLHEGSRVIFQLSQEERDVVDMGTLNIRKQNWQNGPQYLAPVFQIDNDFALTDGMYKLGKLESVESGSLTDIIIEGAKTASGSRVQLIQENGKLYLCVGAYVPGSVEDDDDEEVTWTESFRLDFEEAGTTYGFEGNAAMSQQEMANGKHCFHIDQAAGSGDRSSSIDLASKSDAFTNATDYVFMFDWGHSVSNQNASTMTVKTDDGETLFYITTPSYGASTLYNAAGVEIASIVNDGYSKAVPTKLSHFKVTSNENGTYLTVTYNGTIVASNYKLNAGLKHITGIEMWLGRSVSHMAVDDIILRVKEVKEVTNVQNIDADEEELEITGIYNVAGLKLHSLQPGVNIIMMNNGTAKKVVVTQQK